MFSKILSVVAILLTTFATVNIFAQSQLVDQPALLQAKADTLLQQAISFKEHVGITAGVYADNQILWTSGAGFSNSATQSPADKKMVHRTASISKPMTAVAIMQLMERGQLELDVPIQKYVPEFPIKPEGDITVRHILTHTSGIPHYKNMKDGFSFQYYADLNSAMDRFKDRKLVGTPGKVYQYSTYSYVVLGVIIEKVSGMPYEEYMKKNIWDPAGMRCTSVEKRGIEIPNKSKLYVINKKGAFEEDIQTDLSMKIPGGGIQSTAGDLLRFGETLLNNQLIKQETLEQMLVDPEIRKKEAGNPYGMGWFLYANDEKGRVIGHSGGQAGTSAQFMIAVDKGIVVSCMSNTRGDWGNIFRLSWQLIDLCLSAEARAKPLPKTIVMSNEKLDRFTGTYDFGSGNKMVISRKGNQLFSKYNKYPELKLFPERDNRIFYRKLDAYFEFELNDKGEVVKTSYSQNGNAPAHPRKIK